ncbi:hypothetical protein FRC15_003268 [Serendipita sp. 397]|nr:hypothetical protein FRC15_003268 [Serendipita sp. 397]
MVYLLECLQKTPPPVIIFSDNKNEVDDIQEYLLLKGVEAVAIHGSKTQEERQYAIKSFKSGKKDVMVASGVASKGLDFNEIQHVIIFTMPKEIEDYVHQIGRTGRSGKTGIATTFVNMNTPEQTLLDLKYLLMEAGQKVPAFLQSVEDPRVAQGGTLKGCPVCGGLGHGIANCPKLEDVDNPLGTSNRINTSEPKSVDGFSSSDIQAPKSLRPIITSTERPSRQQTPQRRSPPNKPSRLDQLSMDRLVKLKSSRQQKTIDHADHLLARLKRRDDEDLDLDLIEKQYDLLKSSVKEVEEAILRRRGAENSLTSPGLSTSSASPAIQISKATGMTLRSPESSSSTTVHPPYFNFRSTAIRADISTGDTTISSTISTVSAVTASTMLSSPIKNGTPFRVSRTMDKVDEEEVLWAGMGEFDHNIFQTQRESPERRQKKSNEAEKGPAPIVASGLSPETESSKYRGHPSYIEALTVLRNTFGKEEFRRHQLTAIMETLAGKDVFQSALLG